MQKGEIKPKKIGLAKHGLNIKKKKVNKIKIPHFWLILVRAYSLKREKEKIRRDEEGRRKRMRSSGKETIVRMLVWNIFLV